MVYEGYGPNGVAVIVEALTDNRNRTAPEVRHLLDKYGKGLGATGCVSWSFDKKGVIAVSYTHLDVYKRQRWGWSSPGGRPPPRRYAPPG